MGQVGEVGSLSCWLAPLVELLGVILGVSFELWFPSSGELFSGIQYIGISKIVALWTGLLGGGTTHAGLDFVVGSCFELDLV